MKIKSSLSKVNILRSLTFIFILFFSFSLFANQAHASNPGPWYSCAQSNGFWNAYQGGCYSPSFDSNNCPLGTGVMSNVPEPSNFQTTLHPCAAPQEGSEVWIQYYDGAPACTPLAWQDTGYNTCYDPTATMSVTSCAQGGSWSLSPGGYSSSPSTVYSTAGGTTYSLNYTPPAGYIVSSIFPASSQTTFPGGSYSFTATCSAVTPPAPTVTTSASPSTLSCPSTTTITWSSTNATSCVTNWDSATVGTSGSKSVTVNSTGSYNVTCTGPGGTGNQSTTVTVTSPSCGSPAPSVSVSASPTSITNGQSTTISWSSSNATSCSAWWTGSTATAGSQSVSPASNTTYTMTCSGAGGSGNNSANVTVSGGGSPPSVSVSASPGSGTSGMSSTVTWSSSNASSCSASWAGAVSTSGSQTISNITTTTAYTVTCSGPGGSGSGSATVTIGSPGTAAVVVRSNIPATWSVNPGGYSTTTPSTGYVYLINACATYTITPGVLAGYSEVTTVTNNNSSPANYTGNSFFLCPSSTYSAQFQMTYTANTTAPTATISASPTSITNGQSSTITWSSTNATSCTASGGWSGAKATSGSQSFNPSSTTTYTITCTGPGGSNSQGTTVTVSSGSPPPDPTYVGCYLDDASRALPNQLISSGATIETCKAAALAQNLKYAGLQYGGQCFAGNTLGYSPLPESSCNMPCDANASEICGGSWANSVYIVPVTPPTTSTINVTSPTSWTLNPGGNTSSPATVTPDPVNGTQYTLTITGSCASPNITNDQGGGASVTLHGGETVNYTVTCAPPPMSYSLSNQQSPQSIPQGNSSTLALVKASLNSGTSQNVTLNVSWVGGQPPGVSSSVVPSSGCSPALGSDCPFTINLGVTGATPAATYPFTVSGSPAASNGSLSYNLVVTPALSGGSTGVAGVPNPDSTGQQVTWTSCAASGGTPPYSYSWTGTDIASPIPTLTNTLLYTYTKTGLKTMNVSIKDSSTPQQTVTCSPAGSVKVVLNTNYQEF